MTDWHWSEVQEVQSKMAANLRLPQRTSSAKRRDCPHELLSPNDPASCSTKQTLEFFDVPDANGQEKAEQILVKEPAHWEDDQVYKYMKQLAFCYQLTVKCG